MPRKSKNRLRKIAPAPTGAQFVTGENIVTRVMIRSDGRIFFCLCTDA